MILRASTIPFPPHQFFVSITFVRSSATHLLTFSYSAYLRPVPAYRYAAPAAPRGAPTAHQNPPKAIKPTRTLFTALQPVSRSFLFAPLQAAAKINANAFLD